MRQGSGVVGRPSRIEISVSPCAGAVSPAPDRTPPGPSSAPTASGVSRPFPAATRVPATIRTMFINIGFFAAVVLLIPAIASQFSTSAVVIEPIAVPQALADRGLTAEAVHGLDDLTFSLAQVK